MDTTQSPITPEQLAGALRAQAAGVNSLEAAVGLLIEHGTWLHHPDFRAFVTYHPDSGLASIDWANVAHALARGTVLGSSNSALQVLGIACELAGHSLPFGQRWTLAELTAGLGRVNAALVLQAIARRMGWHVLGLTVAINGEIGGMQ
ncbi:hypothetical protein [Actinokineospora sp. UTMC 2448]|uniref:hypothetical protein n=1 Tax=Actinokineospora sp. UTMC 2448 TaxID=2268449 RepID=UPI002164792E|nr:hypothetical protein [Actinokineospora sp. UTMC 2448]UVS81809.1 hypothetical protein Actkin_05573 [Actinokineospora sp. UTMC 2448]